MTDETRIVKKANLNHNMLNAAFRGNLTEVKECLSSGADTQATDAEGNNALHRVILGLSAVITQTLNDSKKPMDAETQQRRAATVGNKIKNYQNIITLLLEKELSQRKDQIETIPDIKLLRQINNINMTPWGLLNTSTDNSKLRITVNSRVIEHINKQCHLRGIYECRADAVIEGVFNKFISFFSVSKKNVASQSLDQAFDTDSYKMVSMKSAPPPPIKSF